MVLLTNHIRSTITSSVEKDFTPTHDCICMLSVSSKTEDKREKIGQGGENQSPGCDTTQLQLLADRVCSAFSSSRPLKPLMPSRLHCSLARSNSSVLLRLPGRQRSSSSSKARSSQRWKGGTPLEALPASGQRPLGWCRCQVLHGGPGGAERPASRRRALQTSCGSADRLLT